MSQQSERTINYDPIYNVVDRDDFTGCRLGQRGSSSDWGTTGTVYGTATAATPTGA